MRYLIAAVVAAIFLTGGLARAQTPPAPSAESLAAARELVQAMKATDQFKILLPVIIQAIKPAFVQGRPEMEKNFEAIAPAILDVATAHLSEITDQLAVIYANNLNVSELHDMKTFFQSPTGQKYLMRQSDIAQESLAVGQHWAVTLSAELKQTIADELLKRRNP